MEYCLTDKMVDMAEDPQSFLDHIKYVLKHDGDKFHLGIEYPWLGFMEDYQAIAKAICKENIIIDVGCAAGFQQVFFKDFGQYIGINEHSCGEKVLQKNAHFVIGEFKDVIDDVLENIVDHTPMESPWRGKRDIFGIANMSILYAPHTKENLIKFKNTFDRCFIR